MNATEMNETNGPGSRRARRWSLTTIVVFAAALLVPALDLAFGLDPDPSPLKEVVPFPALRFDRSLVSFPGKVQWYVKSSMGFRGALVHARGLLMWNLLGISPSSESVLRVDPWLFLRSERVVDDFRRVDLFSTEALDRWRTVFEDRRAWLAARGISYLVVVAPNKETVYAEAVPPWFTRQQGPSRLMQLGEALRATPVDYLDLSSVIERHKVDGRLYYLTDTHWNDLGAFVGYGAIAERLKRSFPNLDALGTADLDRQSITTRGGDLARLCGLQSDLREPQDQLHLRAADATSTLEDGSPLTFERLDVRGKPDFKTRDPRGEIPSAVVLRDSFGEALLPTLARHFRAARWIWTYDFPARAIEEEHPSIVIEEMVERKLMTIEPSNPPEVERASR